MLALAFALAAALACALTLALVMALAALQVVRRRVARQDAQIAQLSAELAARDAALQQARRERREMLANVSHDLRTPLAAMQGYIELLLLRHGSLEPAVERNYLQTAARQSQRLGRLVGDLFELTQLEAGERPLQAEDFALAELAQDVVQKFGREAEQRGVRLEAHGGSRAPPLQVHADPGLVERVLEGLVENALRHTAAGGCVAIEIDRSGTRAALRVRDDGEGIAAEDLPGLFDRYDRAARVRGGGEPGLGLAIARRIARLHGSELDVRSTRGRGTEVGFELPLAVGARSAGLAA